MTVPHFKTRDEYRAYMAQRRAEYEAAPARNKTTNGPPIPVSEIRRFQQSHGISAATKKAASQAPAQGPGVCDQQSHRIPTETAAEQEAR